MADIEDDLNEAAKLLNRLTMEGIGVQVEDEDLRVSAPKRALDDELRSHIRSHKSAIIQLLKSRDSQENALMPRASRDRPCLSPLQERFWLLEKIEAVGAANNVPMMLRFKGNLDRQALARSLFAIVGRHEVLRTRIETEGGQPFQVIEPSLHPDWLRTSDLSGLQGEALETAVSEHVRTALWTSFDLEAGALIRTDLIKLAHDEHLLLVAMHHLVSDGWSMDVFVSELETFYNAFSPRGQSSVVPLPPLAPSDPLTPLAPVALQYLPPLGLQYADYAVWERRQQERPERIRQLEYWQRQLSGAPASFDIPTDYPRPDRQSFRGKSYRFAFPAELLRSLKALGRTEHATLFIILMAAKQAFLGRYSRQRDVIIGSPITNRPTPELEKLIGFFVNTLAFRANLNGDPSFQELLGQVKETAIQAYANQDVAFEAIVAAVRPVRDLSRSVLQIMLSLHNEPHRQPSLVGLATRLEVVETPTAKSDLNFNYHEAADGLLRCRVEYATDLFEEATIGQLLERFELFLKGIVSDPACPISQLPLINDKERSLLVEEWSDVQRILASQGAQDPSLANILSLPLPQTQVRLEKAYVLDSNLQLTPPGWPGDLYLEWAIEPLERHSDEVEKAQLIASPFHSRRWLFHTGNRAVWRSAGQLELQTFPDRISVAPLSSPTAKMPVEASGAAFQSPIEAMLADIWMEALDIPQVSPHDNFFTLGGHSIIGMQVIARIYERTGISVPVRILFEAQCLREMAASIEQEAGCAA